MVEIIGSYLLTGLLGFACMKALQWIVPSAHAVRISIFVLLPLALLFAAFLAFFDGAPVGEDWVWLGIGLVYFWPWYLAWLAGWAMGALFKRMTRRSAG